MARSHVGVRPQAYREIERAPAKNKSPIMARTGLMIRLRIPFFIFLLLASKLVVVRAVVSAQETPTDCVNGHCSKRTLYDIVWGCLTTTLICAWTAVHPNIPPREGPLKGLLRRLELMFWAVVAPEVIPCWALNQLLAAISVRNLYNEGKGYVKESPSIWDTLIRWVSMREITNASQAWTLWHGHFLIMGGFHLVEPPEEEENAKPTTEWPMSTIGNFQSTSNSSLGSDIEGVYKPTSTRKQGGVTILTLELLRELLVDPEFELRTTEAEIKDRSKGDALSKFIFMVQTSWFIVQCIARRVQGLNLTQLELTTLALASLNGITVLLWWSKPLGVQTPVRVYLQKRLKLRKNRSPLKKITATNRWEVVAIILSFPFYPIMGCRPQNGIFTFVLGLVLFLPLGIVFFPAALIIAFVLITFSTISDLLISSQFPANNQATHVPTFYVPKHQYSEYWHFFLLLALGPVFGAVHCAGWNFSFPTHTYQGLWRIASLAITIIPISTPTVIFIILTTRNFMNAVLGQSTRFVLPSLYEIATSSQVLLGLFVLMYAVARFILLGLAIALLGDQPPPAFIALDWTKYYPHF